jgi:hypothetical protein
MTQVPPPPSDTNQPKKAWYNFLERWKVLLEVIAIPFAIMYAIVTGLQWKDLHHNFVTDERPWLKFEPAAAKPGDESVSWQLGVEKPVTYPVKVVNIGKTPATDIDMRIFVEIVDADHEAALEKVDDYMSYPHGKITAGIVFPNQDFKETVIRPLKGGAPQLATPREIGAMYNGRAYLAVYGIINYRDMFKIPRWTKFCSWVALTGNFQADDCTKYNSVDSK